MEVAESTKNITTFRKLLKGAGVGPTITGTRKFTNFAPSDEAFTYLGESKLKGLLATKDVATLKKLVELHVISGEKTSTDQKEKKALSGDMVKTFVDDVETSYGNSVVETKDIAASNGVIYVIDSLVRVYSDDD